MNSIMSINSPLLKNKQNSPLILWLDASDPSGNGTFFSSNTTFSRWIDKSGYGNNASALTTSNVSTTMSYVRNGFNTSYPTFNFSGNSNRFAGSFSANTAITGNSTRCFIVCGMSSSSASGARAIAFSQTYGADDWNNNLTWTFTRQNNTGIGAWRNNGNPYISNNSSAYNLPLIWESWYDGTTAFSTFLNGSSTVIKSSGSSGVFNINFYSIGLNTNPTDTNSIFVGNISEILIYNGTLTTSQSQQTEAYLAYKWGLQSTLPSSNPYTSAPSNPYK